MIRHGGFMEIIDMQQGLVEHSSFLINYRGGVSQEAPARGIEAGHRIKRGTSFISHNAATDPCVDRLPMSSCDKEVELARHCLSPRFCARLFENAIQLVF